MKQHKTLKMMIIVVHSIEIYIFVFTYDLRVSHAVTL